MLATVALPAVLGLGDALGLVEAISAQSITSVPTSFLPPTVATTSAVRYAMPHP